MPDTAEPGPFGPQPCLPYRRAGGGDGAKGGVDGRAEAGSAARTRTDGEERGPEVCLWRDISRQTLYLHRRRFGEEGFAGLEPRSRRDEGPASDLAELQALLDRFPAHYNEQRPHRGISDQTVAQSYKV